MSVAPGREHNRQDGRELINYEKFLFLFLKFFIRYFPRLHFQCYPKSPPYPPPQSPTQPLPHFDPGVFLVGANSVGMQDSYSTAISHNSQMYGVEIHANIIDALLKGKTQLPVSPFLYATASAFLCGIFFVVIRRAKIIPVSVGTGILAVLDVLFVRFMYEQGILVPVVLVPAMLILIYGERVIEGYLAEILRRRKVVNVFKQYVADRKSVV